MALRITHVLCGREGGHSVGLLLIAAARGRGNAACKPQEVFLRARKSVAWARSPAAPTKNNEQVERVAVGWVARFR